jgi:hypothetical protein
VLAALQGDPRSAPLQAAIHEHLLPTFAAGVDEIQDVYEELTGSGEPATPPRDP